MGTQVNIYSLRDAAGPPRVMIFEEFDDAERYVIMLEQDETYIVGETLDMDTELCLGDTLDILNEKGHGILVKEDDLFIPPKLTNMLIFKKLRYKNFLSSGDSFTEIDFLANSNNLIVGSNGAGKSTILDALTFVLFNKPFRKINKPQLVNSVNEKNCSVEIEFSSNNRDYLVRRGIKPNVFDIEVDGELLDKRGDDRDNQQTLEENILKVNYKSFTQIVILGSSTFVPFMQLSAAYTKSLKTF